MFFKQVQLLVCLVKIVADPIVAIYWIPNRPKKAISRYCPFKLRSRIFGELAVLRHDDSRCAKLVPRLVERHPDSCFSCAIEATFFLHILYEVVKLRAL
jgi:hypothetical protein